MTKTPYFSTEIPQIERDGYRPYGPNRAEVDAAAGAIVSEKISRELNENERSISAKIWLNLWSPLGGLVSRLV